MSFGKYHCFPKRFGSAKESELEAIEKSFKAGQGTALERSSPIRDCKNHAIARGLWALSMDSQRCANVYDVSRSGSNLLNRWEKICGLQRNKNQSDSIRREALVIHRSLYGEAASIQRIVDVVSNVVSPKIFLSATPITQEEAAALFMLSMPSGPITVPGGEFIENGPFRSHVACLSFRVTDANVSALEFWDAIARIEYHLENLLPSWITWTYWVVDGFILDQQNLDYAQFVDPGPMWEM